MYNTSMIVQFITTNKLLLKIAFVGPNLDKVVDYLASSTHMTDNSYLVLHYYPSILASRHKLQPMLVPLCQDPLLQHDRSNPACFFNVNRLAKVVWMPVQKEAPKLYNFIQHFSFHFKEYIELLYLYNSEIEKKPNADIETDIACVWLNSEGRNWLNRKMDLMKLQEKPKLYIGGIFPLSGTKYIAPVLADGNTNHELLSAPPYFSV